MLGYISKGLQIMITDKGLPNLGKDPTNYFGEYYSAAYSRQNSSIDKKMSMRQKDDPLILHTHHKKHS